MSFILLHSGEYFCYDNLYESPIHIGDIAHSLSMLCRYNGHVPKFYSVAEHSVYVSMLVPEEEAFAALLHDATEAYIGDMVRPLKQLIPAFANYEDQLAAAIQKKFRVGSLSSPAIKKADNEMLLAEMKFLLENGDEWFQTDLEPANIRPLCLPPEKAKAMFLHRYFQLMRFGDES